MVGVVGDGWWWWWWVMVGGGGGGDGVKSFSCQLLLC